MTWIDRYNIEPNPKLKYILVWGMCGCPHIAFYDYYSWNHTECCFDSGNHMPGSEIKFKYWQKAPERPEKI